jgi:hypothetical protein
MARSGQVQFIEDLMEKHDLMRADLANEHAEWGRYEGLPPDEASELLDWLQDYGR